MQQNGSYDTDPSRFDYDELFERVDGDEELIREVLAIFLEDAPRLLGEIKTGLEKASPEIVANTAHTLKGAAANIAAHRLRDQAYQIELTAKSEEMAGALNIYADLEAEFIALKHYLSPYLGQ